MVTVLKEDTTIARLYAEKRRYDIGMQFMTEAAIDAGKLPFERGVMHTEDDLIRQYVIMELMSNFKLDIKRFEKLFNIEFKTYFADAIEALKPFAEDDLLTMDENTIECSETGTLLIRNIAMPFDAYMKKHAASSKTFSKTV